MTDEVNSWRQFFENFSYKPTWRFEGYVDFDTNGVVITMRVPDSRTPLPDPEYVVWASAAGVRKNIPLVPITKTVILGRWISEEYAKDFIRWHIRDMEDHEIDEWFRYKGELVFDPHKEK